MGVTVQLPGALEPFARGRATFTLAEPCGTVGAAFAGMSAEYPGVHDRVLDERGELRPHVNVFVDEHNIRYLQGLATPLGPHSTIFILPAVSGG
jgi:molybdopterin synthase sulfur carrier subunit